MVSGGGKWWLSKLHHLSRACLAFNIEVFLWSWLRTIWIVLSATKTLPSCCLQQSETPGAVQMLMINKSKLFGSETESVPRIRQLCIILGRPDSKSISILVNLKGLLVGCRLQIDILNTADPGVSTYYKLATVQKMMRVYDCLAPMPMHVWDFIGDNESKLRRVGLVPSIFGHSSDSKLTVCFEHSFEVLGAIAAEDLVLLSADKICE